MHLQDALRRWITGMCEGKSEDAQVETLLNVLKVLLDHPEARQLRSLANYRHRLHTPGYGVDDLTNTIIAATEDLTR